MTEDDSSRWSRRDVLRTTGTIGAAAGFGGVASATPGREPGAKEEEVLVGVSKAAIESKSLGGPKAAVDRVVPGNARVVHENAELSYVAVKFPAEAPEVARENFIEAVTKKEGVKYAETNETYEATMTPDDPRFGDQYAPQTVNAPTAWDTTTGSSDVTVAVVDTGAQYSHPDLQGNYASDPGYDFADGDSDPA
ncbi:twin-arginine translocation signal domain-containing protein, partial [Halobium palmae]